MDYVYEPTGDYEPTGFEPLDLDDEGEYENPYDYDDPYANDSYEEDVYEEPGLGGFDDLKPFGSFDDGFGWDDGFL